MGCFIAPLTEAVIVTVASKALKLKEKRELESGKLITTKRKLKWLSTMLWGGSALLIFEHFWNGEVVPFFPFLTSVSNWTDFVAMLKEVVTVGGTMSLLITAVWIVMVTVVSIWEKKIFSERKKLSQEE